MASADGEARTHLEAALRIALDMQGRGTLAPTDAFIPDMLREELAKLSDAR